MVCGMHNASLRIAATHGSGHRATSGGYSFIMPIPIDLHRPGKPGLFITGTDTGVGKTVVACLIADQWRRQFGVGIGGTVVLPVITGHRAPSRLARRVGVLKPIATGCRHEREGLVSEDAEQLAHAADFDSDIGDLDLIAPIRFKAALTPAAALELEHRGADGRAALAGRVSGLSGARSTGFAPSLDWPLLDRSLRRLDAECDRIVVEGIGGVLAPIESMTGETPVLPHAHPTRSNKGESIVTVLDLIMAIGYPVVVVCRACLGTLNHTALTCEALRRRGAPIAGLVVNGHEPDSQDLSQSSNLDWLRRQNGTRILAVLPGRFAHESIVTGCGSTGTHGSKSRATSKHEAALHKGKALWNAMQISPELRDAIDTTDFGRLAKPGRAIETPGD